MSINRNDPCPCGSGLKYKKCCLNQQKVVQLQEVKEKRFFSLKEALSRKMLDFLHTQLSYSEIQMVNSHLKGFLSLIPPDYMDLYLNVWRCYFYQYPNGLRGIDWYYANAKGLSQDETSMLRSWTEITPHLLQAVDQNRDGYWFEDLITHNKYYFPKNELLNHVLPWSVIMTLIEPYEDGYCIHGVSGFHTPTNAQAMANVITEKMEQLNLTYSNVMQEYFPELYQTFLSLEQQNALFGERSTQTITHLTLHYKIRKHEAVTQFLLEQHEFVIDEWTKDHKLMSWTDSWYRYTDNQCVGAIYLGEVLAEVEIKGDNLTFSSMQSQCIKQFQDRLTKLGSVLTYIKTERNEFESPYNVRLTSSCIRMNNENPQYFSLFAQTQLHELDINEPIPMFGDQSPIELIQDQQSHLVEQWLREREYRNADLVKSQLGVHTEHTYNSNYIRKKLQLPLSPFVSGGKERCTTLEPCYNPERPNLIKQAEIPIYESLGFNPTSAQEFYARDIYQFFIGNTSGTSTTTRRKYDLALETLVYYLSDIEQKALLTPPFTWLDCDHGFWEYFFYTYLDEEGYDFGLTFRKNLYSVMKKLAQWIDEKYSTKMADVVKGIGANLF